MQRNPYKDKILKTIQKLCYRHSPWNIFGDFVELGALCIANSCADKKTAEWEAREKRYLEIIGKYDKDEQQQFPIMFADLVQALEYALTWENAPVDILGELFHELELHNQFKGQFFTPQHICDFMGKIALGDSKADVERQGFISCCEPACGSGAMVLGFARAMLEAELNYCSQLVVEATDIDQKCCYMCFLQLSLYGIPAIVIHGNTLTLEEWSRRYTPVYVIHGWRWKRRRSAIADKIDSRPVKELESLKTPETMGQLSLFDMEAKN